MWARRSSIHFTKKVKKMLFEEIDNMMWRGKEKAIDRSWSPKTESFELFLLIEIAGNDSIKIEMDHVWITHVGFDWPSQAVQPVKSPFPTTQPHPSLSPTSYHVFTRLSLSTNKESKQKSIQFSWTIWWS